MKKQYRPNYILYLLRFIGFWGISFVVWPTMELQLKLAGEKGRDRVTRRWAKWWCYLVAQNNGYEVEVRGKLPPQGTLIVANHVSYADIVALNSVIACCFVAKAEIAKWPLLGHFTKLGNSVFVSRRRSDKALRDQSRMLSERLEKGNTCAVFAEGTTGDGNEVLPFKSALLQPVIDAQCQVTPVAIHWHTENPRLDVQEDIAYWRDTHDMLSHSVRHFGKNSKKVTICFGDQIDPDGLDRKTLAQKAYDTVKTMFDVVKEELTRKGAQQDERVSGINSY